MWIITGNRSRCTLCDTTIASEPARVAAHEQGQRHIQLLRAYSNRIDSEGSDSEGSDSEVSDSNSDGTDDAFRTIDSAGPEINGISDTSVFLDESDNGSDVPAGYLDYGSENSLPDALMIDTTPFYPYPDRNTFLFSMIANVPKSPLSDTFLKVLHWWCRQLGVQMPALSTVRRVETNVFDEVMNAPVKATSCEGLPFYYNSIKDAIRADIANPYVRKFLRQLPEDAGDRISEMYQGLRWKEDPDMATPMITTGDRHIYRHEFYRKEPDQVIYIERFLIRDTVIVVSYFLTVLSSGSYWISEGDRRDCPLADIKERVVMIPYDQRSEVDPSLFYLKGAVEGRRGRRFTIEKASEYCADNHLRSKADGRMIVFAPIIIFCDDMSGNRSKRWNKYESWYWTFAGLPPEEVNKEYNIHFLATSNAVSGMKMLPSFVDDMIADLNAGFIAFDAVDREEVLVVGTVFIFVGDNPMQSAFCSHIGTSGLKPCRICTAAKFDATADSLMNFITPGPTRSSVDTFRELRRQISRAGLWGNKESVRLRQKETGVKCTITEDYITVCEGLRFLRN
jgi:hypothetical protein